MQVLLLFFLPLLICTAFLCIFAKPVKPDSISVGRFNKRVKRRLVTCSCGWNSWMSSFIRLCTAETLQWDYRSAYRGYSMYVVAWLCRNSIAPGHSAKRKQYTVCQSFSGWELKSKLCQPRRKCSYRLAFEKVGRMNTYGKWRRRWEIEGAERKGEWKCEDRTECSHVNCEWTP